MNKIVIFVNTFLTLCLFSNNSYAKGIPIKLLEYQKVDGLEEKLRDIDFLSGLSSDLNTSRIFLSVSLYKDIGGGELGTNLTSVILSGSSMGLIPIVESKTVTLQFQLNVHGEWYTEYIFSKPFNDVKNFWSIDTSVVTSTVADWVLSKTDELKKQIDHDPKIKALSNSYYLYFDEEL